MKKLLALVFALMLFAMPALAEIYTQPEVGYTVECPEGWLAVDNTTIDAYISAYETGAMTFTGTNADTLQQIKAQLTFPGSMIMIDPYANNVVITAADMGMEFTMEMFHAAMAPMMREQFVAQIPDITFVDEGSILEMNGRKYMTIVGTYEAFGTTVGVQQIYYLEGSTMYIFNVTVSAIAGEEYLLNFDLVIDQIVSSFNNNK